MPRSIDAMDDEQLLNRYWMYRQKVQRMDEELHAIRHDFRLVSLKRPARQEAYLSYKQYKDALLDPNRAGAWGVGPKGSKLRLVPGNLQALVC